MTVIAAAIWVAIIASVIRPVAPSPVVTSIAGIPIIATISVTRIPIIATISVTRITIVATISVARISPVTITAPLSYIAIYAIVILRVCGRGGG
jgi:hypothetical protein